MGEIFGLKFYMYTINIFFSNPYICKECNFFTEFVIMALNPSFYEVNKRVLEGNLKMSMTVVLSAFGYQNQIKNSTSTGFKIKYKSRDVSKEIYYSVPFLAFKLATIEHTGGKMLNLLCALSESTCTFRQGA